MGSSCSELCSLKYGQLRQLLSFSYTKNLMAAGDSSIMCKINLDNWGRWALKLFLTATKLAREQKRTPQAASHLALPLTVNHKGQILLRGREV